MRSYFYFKTNTPYYAECEEQRFFCFRSKRVEHGLFFVHEYLVAVDLTSHVGTIPTWLASYFHVLFSTALRLLSGE